MSLLNPGAIKSELFGKISSDLISEEATNHSEFHVSGIKIFLSGLPQVVLEQVYEQSLRMTAQLVAESASLGGEQTETSADIHDALTSPRPRARYVDGTIMGTPTTLFHWIWWMLPIRVQDALLLSNQPSQIIKP